MILRIDPPDLPSAGGTLIRQDFGFYAGAELVLFQVQALRQSEYLSDA